MLHAAGMRLGSPGGELAAGAAVLGLPRCLAGHNGLLKCAQGQ